VNIHRFGLFPEIDVNTYLLWSDSDSAAILIDPADASRIVLDFAREHGLQIRLIVITHGHADHIVGLEYFQRETGAEIAIHPEDAPMLTDPHANLSVMFGERLIAPPAGRLLRDGETISLGAESMTVVHSPGHTPGGICLVGGGLAITGDTLFAGSVGRTDLPGGDTDELMTSIRTRLLTFPDETKVFPGHGPQTTIGRERVENPFLNGRL
jgi:hydroxyacylglutathione hydrolase